MPLFCYRLAGDKHTHYGPVEAGDMADLVAKLKKLRNVDLDHLQIWAIEDRKDHMFPPKPGTTAIFEHAGGCFFIIDDSSTKKGGPV